MKKIKSSEVDKNSVLAASIAAAAQSNPLTSALYAAFSEYQHLQQMKSINVVLTFLSKELALIKNQLNPSELSNNMEFNNFSYRVFSKAATESRKEKLQMYAHLLACSTIPNNTNDNDKYSYLEIIDKLTIEQLLLLNKMSPKCITDYYHDNSIKGWKGLEDELKVLGTSVDRFSFNADYLLCLGLTMKINDYSYEQGTMTISDGYFVTAFGKSFLNYINLIQL